MAVDQRTRKRLELVCTLVAKPKNVKIAGDFLAVSLQQLLRGPVLSEEAVALARHKSGSCLS